jgi:hypothetical protein
MEDMEAAYLLIAIHGSSTDSKEEKQPEEPTPPPPAPTTTTVATTDKEPACIVHVYKTAPRPTDSNPRPPLHQLHVYTETPSPTSRSGVVAFRVKDFMAFFCDPPDAILRRLQREIPAAHWLHVQALPAPDGTVPSPVAFIVDRWFIAALVAWGAHPAVVQFVVDSGTSASERMAKKQKADASPPSVAPVADASIFVSTPAYKHPTHFPLLHQPYHLPRCQPFPPFFVPLPPPRQPPGFYVHQLAATPAILM